MKELGRLLQVMNGTETEAIAFAKGNSEWTTFRSAVRKLLHKRLKE